MDNEHNDAELLDFSRAVERLEREALAQVSPYTLTRELTHHRRVSSALSVSGWAISLYLTSERSPQNTPLWWALACLACFCLALGVFSRWIAAHHICHRAYDKAEGLSEHLKSPRFGLGWARLWQWLEWMPTEAWSQEHNIQHHYRLNEHTHDPDIVEDQAWWLRALPLWWPLKLPLIALGACVWKPLYYGPNTLIELERARLARRGEHERAPRLYSWSAWSPLSPLFWLIARRSWLPGLTRLSLLPLAALSLSQLSSLWGADAWRLALSLSVAAELYSNLHSFVVIVPNHAGDDLPRFEGKPASKASFYLRQITGSCDYGTQRPVGDFLMGYLNYQIEHHLWPQMSVTGYRWAQPRLKALCERYGVPYVQASLWRRLWAMCLIATGARAMPSANTLNEPNAQKPPSPRAHA